MIDVKTPTDRPRKVWNRISVGWPKMVNAIGLPGGMECVVLQGTPDDGWVVWLAEWVEAEGYRVTTFQSDGFRTMREAKVWAENKWYPIDV